MIILSLNVGSSSIKYQILDAANEFKLLLKGIAERIGEEVSSMSQTFDNKKEEIDISLPDHRTAMRELYQAMIKRLPPSFNIDAVGHRIVHGGESLRKPVIIDEQVIGQIKKMAQYAPLHCQPNVIGIEIARELMPDIPHVAVFDTGIHDTIEPKAFLYGLPIKLYENYGIRKYGFHGINHQYVASSAAKLLDRALSELKLITCHLGNGCSMTLFVKGKSMDNSMGLTPLEGLVMGSRCGDIDPSIVLYLIQELHMQPNEVSDLLNKRSGLLGLCGSKDMRDIIAKAEKGDNQSKMAIDIFVYRVQKYIGAFAAAANGVDAIIFSGGIGENSSLIRKQVSGHLSFMNAFIDHKKNEQNEAIFSSQDSQVYLMTIPANEELAIAQETQHALHCRS